MGAVTGWTIIQVLSGLIRLCILLEAIPPIKICSRPGKIYLSQSTVLTRIVIAIFDRNYEKNTTEI